MLSAVAGRTPAWASRNSSSSMPGTTARASLRSSCTAPARTVVSSPRSSMVAPTTSVLHLRAGGEGLYGLRGEPDGAGPTRGDQRAQQGTVVHVVIAGNLDATG